MKTIYLDLETYSESNLKKAGRYRYTEAVEILLLAWAVDNGPVNLWDATATSMPKGLSYHIDNAGCICAHNSGFDRGVLEAKGITNAMFSWRDTMVRAHAHGLPGGLDILSQIFKLPVDKAKNKDGTRLIQLFCRPQRDGSRNTRRTHPEEWKRFIEYAMLDIEAMRELDKKLPWWNDTPEERALWQLDQRINDRGFCVDVELATAAIKATASEKGTRDAKAVELTEGAIAGTSQRDALLQYILQEHGVMLPDLQQGTLNRRLEDPDISDAVKELIKLRLQSSGTSTRKYNTLLDSVSSDGRLRGTLQFCGAPRTGRWSGRIFQPQNLPRPKLKNWEIDLGIEAIKQGSADLIWDDVTALASSALRGVIIAPPKRKLVASDLSSIEGRKLAWLAGEEWKLRAYREYDAGIGFDMYVHTYAKTFGIDPADVTGAQRQLGKVLELALGYGGAIGAFMAFADVYGIDLNELTTLSFPPHITDQAESYWYVLVKQRRQPKVGHDIFIACDSVKRMWREANPAIVRLWSNLESDVCRALSGQVVQRKRYTVDKKGGWLRVQLPSGRYLCYAGARADDGVIKYLGVNQYSRKWGTLTTYGGKLAENITQASSRDVFACGMIGAEDAGYNVVLSVHDELITETPDSPEFNQEALSAIMSRPPVWAPDLPLAAKGFEAYRYKKE